jgi:hypothetical protein
VAVWNSWPFLSITVALGPIHHSCMATTISPPSDRETTYRSPGVPRKREFDRAPKIIRAFRILLTFAFAGSVILPGLAYFTSPTETDVVPTLAGLILQIVAYLGVVAVAVVGFHFLAVRIERSVETEALAQAFFLDSIPEYWLNLAIAGSAGLGLFLELAVIRWQGAVFEFFAFYKNYGLLACFAGLGLGYALSRSKEGIPLVLVLPLLSWQFALLLVLRFGLPAKSYSLRGIPFREQLNMGWTATLDQVGVIYLMIAVVFFLTALAFVPVGQLCGKLMERKPQLSAYGFNLLGSVLGVVLMFAVSFLWTGPVVWFGLCALTVLLFSARAPRTLLLTAAFATVAILVLAWPVNPLWNKVYTPYQMLEMGYDRDGLMIIRAAGHYYQKVRNFSGPIEAPDNPLRGVRDYYDLAYKLHPGPNEVAIVGAGSGNDVAAAIRSGARHVEAIEIDPAIQLAGRMNHPERPYEDPRVHAVVNDARTFFRNTDGRFDLIVYGLLDSHTLLSHASSVRLDSFVYTVEGLREARARLKDDGVMSLSFAVLNDDLGTKFFQMMKEAFDGRDPIVISSSAEGAVTFAQSKNGDLSIPSALMSQARLVDRAGFYRDSNLQVNVSTDDWPFLYMPRRVYPMSYLVVLGLIVLFSFVLFASFFRERPEPSQASFFFLGAGFMLVETKAITEMGLVFGNTWQVIGVAIIGILTMAWLGNAIVQRLRPSRPYVSYILLLLSLAAGWWIAKSGGLPSTPVGKLGTAIVLTCPLFFSGIVFSTLLSKHSRISTVMCVNLLGAMCGGILEYNSMYFGFHFLYILAIALYACGLLSTLSFPVKVRVPDTLA